MPFCPNKTMWIVLCKNFQVKKKPGKQWSILKDEGCKLSCGRTGSSAANPSASCGEHSHFWRGWNTGVLQKYRSNQRPSGNTGIPPKQGSIHRLLLPKWQLLPSGFSCVSVLETTGTSSVSGNINCLCFQQFTNFQRTVHSTASISNNNYEKFTCPKWEWSREISIKHYMWSLVWEVIFNSWDTEELMALFRHYSNKLIKNHLFFLTCFNVLC